MKTINHKNQEQIYVIHIFKFKCLNTLKESNEYIITSVLPSTNKKIEYQSIDQKINLIEFDQKINLNDFYYE